jgi:hypothetical protein
MHPLLPPHAGCEPRPHLQGPGPHAAASPPPHLQLVFTGLRLLHHPHTHLCSLPNAPPPRTPKVGETLQVAAPTPRAPPAGPHPHARYTRMLSRRSSTGLPYPLLNITDSYRDIGRVNTSGSCPCLQWSGACPDNPTSMAPAPGQCCAFEPQHAPSLPCCPLRCRCSSCRRLYTHTAALFREHPRCCLLALTFVGGWQQHADPHLARCSIGIGMTGHPFRAMMIP